MGRGKDSVSPSRLAAQVLHTIRATTLRPGPRIHRATSPPIQLRSSFLPLGCWARSGIGDCPYAQRSNRIAQTLSVAINQSRWQGEGSHCCPSCLRTTLQANCDIPTMSVQPGAALAHASDLLPVRSCRCLPFRSKSPMAISYRRCTYVALYRVQKL